LLNSYKGIRNSIGLLLKIFNRFLLILTPYLPKTINPSLVLFISPLLNKKRFKDQSAAIYDEFKFLLAKALKRGVNVFIGYGYKSSFDPIPKSKTQKDAENNLLKLKEWCAEENTDGLLLIAYHPNHSKILICDDTYAVCGSFNWLSNSGKSKNLERSWIVYDKVFVDTEMELIMTANFSRFDRRGFFKKLIPWIKH